MSSSFAQVRSAAAGIVMPARDPYDRELLIEHVIERVRRVGPVSVAVHGRTWSVRCPDRCGTIACSRCRHPVKCAGATSPGEGLRCLRCVFDAPRQWAGAAGTFRRPRTRGRSSQLRDGPPQASVLASVFRWLGLPVGRTAA